MPETFTVGQQVCLNPKWMFYTTLTKKYGADFTGTVTKVHDTLVWVDNKLFGAAALTAKVS